MSVQGNAKQCDAAVDILASVRVRGARVWSDNGRIRYRAPKGVLSSEDIASILAFKEEILILLEQNTHDQVYAEQVGSPASERYFAPLTFSQLAHWNLYQLVGRHAIRQIASAARLQGVLDVRILQESVIRIVRRHDALRTRIIVLDGVPTQEILESSDSQIRLSDLSDLPEKSLDAAIYREVAQHIMEPIDLAAGPLFGVRLVRIGESEHVLIIAMEHMISDMFSLKLVWAELFAVYTQLLAGRPEALAPVNVQFPEYAAWQRGAHDSWKLLHAPYWHERLSVYERLRFPDDRPSESLARSGWAVATVHIDEASKEALREWARTRKTTIVLSVFAAYVALVLRWCNSSDGVIRYVSDGRISPDVRNTVGFFPSILYLRGVMMPGDNFDNFLCRVTEEYCRAYEHADFFYFASQTPRPEFTKNPSFNWIPEESIADSSLTDYFVGGVSGLAATPIRFEHPMLRDLDLDIEPYALAFDSKDEILIDLHFPMNRFGLDTIQRFSRNFSLFLKEILSTPHRCVTEVELCD